MNAIIFNKKKRKKRFIFIKRKVSTDHLEIQHHQNARRFDDRLHKHKSATELVVETSCILLSFLYGGFSHQMYYDSQYIILFILYILNKINLS